MKYRLEYLDCNTIVLMISISIQDENEKFVKLY